MLKKILISAAVVSAFGTASAQQRAIIITEVAPPPIRQERVPQARHGHEWAPGHWELRQGRWEWREGRWLRERRGMHWVPEQWVQRPNGRWEMMAGHWERGERRGQYMGNRGMGNRGMGDRDHDGVQNRYDRDRDGDGIPNHRDSRPNNPNRY